MSRPVENFREGNISVSIFENDGPKGEFRSAAIQLRYKDKESGEWKQVPAMGQGTWRVLRRPRMRRVNESRISKMVHRPIQPHRLPNLLAKAPRASTMLPVDAPSIEGRGHPVYFSSQTFRNQP